MMRLRRAPATVALFLLALTATAHADCAWVLWSEEQKSPIVSRWIVVQSHVDANDCRQAQAQKLRRMGAEDGAQIEGNIVKFKDREQRFRVLCLPDTVDPREPKGAR
jgi:hypothetical protein